MKEVLKTSDQVNSSALPNVISSLALGDGVTLCGSQGGQMSNPFGPAPAPANLSPRQAKEQGRLMSGTCGPHGSISSKSATLQRSLANRLKQRFDLDGSILFKMTWKEKATPAGRQLCQLMRSERTIKGSGYGGWPTPNARDGKDLSRTTAYLAARERHSPSLTTVLLGRGTPWPAVAPIYCLAMGYPLQWNEARLNAWEMPSSRKLPKRSSKPIKTAVEA